MVPATPTSPPHSLFARLVATLREAWTARQTPWWVVALAALAFALRKTWALHTPQLYAEDACIFLFQQEQFGFRSLLEPYMGYLHTLPRLIAWFSATFVDPAWWPAIYSGASFAITIALFFRIASARLDVPGKPLMLFAFAFAAHTGEVPLNITNLQWVSVFFLVIQPLLTAPTTHLSRAGDCLIILLVGLTGPFSVLMLPAYVWAWWRDRRPATLLPLLLLAVCAAIQLSFILRAGSASAAPGETFRPLAFLPVISSRLVVWSLFGSAAVPTAPVLYRIVIGLLALAALLWWTFRPHPRRPQHVILLLGFAAIAAAGFYRARVDTWDHNDLVNGDRYFYVPRVLLFWFLAWACAAPQRAIAWPALVLVIVGFATQLPTFFYAAPPDLRWADHCEPIRRGVPAKIPILPVGWDLDYPGRSSP